jgi:hypothetical protein
MAGAFWPLHSQTSRESLNFRLEWHLWGSRGCQVLASIDSQFHLNIPINRPDLGTAISAYSLASSKERVEVTSVGSQ